MLSRFFFAIAAATLLWAIPASAWEPEIVGLDGTDTRAAQVTFAAIDGITLVTPEMVSVARTEATPAIAANDHRSGERIAHHCTCK